MFKKIFIRADGSSEIGLGHLVRCLALAQMLKKEFSINFVSKEIPEKIEKQIIEQGFAVNKIESEEDFFSNLKGWEIVVIDHYGLDSNYQKKIKDLKCKLVCIDDLHNKEYYADLIINHSPGIKPEDYKAQSYTRFALGPEYALLRSSFIKAAKKKRVITKIDTILICFGGSDHKNITLKVLNAIKNQYEYKRIAVVLGAAYSYQKSLDEVRLGTENIEILSSLNETEMLAEILVADLAIVPASGILLEVVAGGSIPLICYYAENQREVFNFFIKNYSLPFFDALNFNEGDFRSTLEFINSFENISHGGEIRKKISYSAEQNFKNFKELYCDV